MAENWITQTLCSLDEKVRIERGPQIIELDCNDANLSDSVTAPHYRNGGRDATGRLIRPDLAGDKAVKQARIEKERGIESLSEGEKMLCVDYREKHAPWLWKIYQSQEFEQLNQKTGEHETISKFVKVDEVEGKDDALAKAHAIRKEMK